MTNPALCANPRFPECKHPEAAHIPGGCDECTDIQWTCDRYVAPADTVSVAVQVPPPPEDCDRWEQVLGDDLPPARGDAERVVWLRARRKREPLVAVMLTRVQRDYLLACLDTGTGSFGDAIRQACRDAKASAPVCGIPVAVDDPGYPHMAKCLRDAGHAGRCSPVKP